MPPETLKTTNPTLTTTHKPQTPTPHSAGFATEQEVMRQQTQLRSALAAAGWRQDASTDAAECETIVMQVHVGGWGGGG